MSVFVVEDTAVVRDRLVMALSEIAGVRVIGTASTAASATASINYLKPDLVSLDLRLSSGTGWDVLKSLTCEPTVFVLTNFADQWTREKTGQLPVARFFDKSKEFGAFLESVRELTPPTHQGA